MNNKIVNSTLHCVPVIVTKAATAAQEYEKFKTLLENGKVSPHFRMIDFFDMNNKIENSTLYCVPVIVTKAAAAAQGYEKLET